TERTGDVLALGRLLQEWLPPRPRRWQRQPLALLYRVCDAALAGEYLRPAELAVDLEQAWQASLVRWRLRPGKGALLALVLLPVRGLRLLRFLEYLGVLNAAEQGGWGALAASLAKHLLLATAFSALLLGCVHGRVLASYHRLRSRRALRRPSLWQGGLPALAQ